MTKEKIEHKRQLEIRTVNKMIEIYCHKKHHTKGHNLCKECQDLANYATSRTLHCPFMETKSFCSQCKVHCYAPIYKTKIKEVMKFSGPYMMLYHPILAIKHLYYTLKAIKKQKKEKKLAAKKFN